MCSPEPSLVTGGVSVMANLLTLDRVHAWLGDKEVLCDVSFTVAESEVTGLIGTNGAGKTTILRAILGMTPLSSGRVLMEGHPIRRRDRWIAYVPQKVHLDPDMPLRARDLVSLGIDGHRFGLPLDRRRNAEAAQEMLDSVGASELADRKVGRLSGGEQQRVLIAHALISRPRLMLLDEPLANLDIGSVAEVVELIATAARDHQVAVLISAHDMNPLLGVLDTLVYVAGGRAVHGTVDEIVRSAVLSKLYGHPVQVIEIEGRILVVAGRGSTVL